jgi:protein arginine N-methyltransferase 1
MNRDTGRLAPYLEALRRVVTDESVVLDIGTGTGIFAHAAAMAGARRVIAVEPNDIIEVAREIARTNELSIEFHREHSRHLELEERADVIVSDLRGVSPFHPGHIETIVDARERLLAEDGVLIARADTLSAAPVEDREAWKRHLGHWDDNLLGLDMSSARRLAANVRFHHDTQPAQLVAEPQPLTMLDYSRVDSTDLDAEVTFGVTRAGTVHGFSVWFESELHDGLTVSTAPGEPLLAYGRPLYPLESPLEVETGDSIRLRFRTVLVRGSYVTSWSGELADGPRFSQSTMGIGDFGVADLDLLRPENTPRAARDSKRLATFLDWLDGATSVDALTRRVEDRFGDDFASSGDLRAWISRTIRTHAER